MFVPGESLTGWAVWVFVATGCAVTAAAPRPAFAAETPMSQVMPDTGVVSTDGEVLPEVYHQAVKAMVAHRGNPILIRDVRVIVIAATGFCITEFIAPYGQFEKIDFGNSGALEHPKVQSAPRSGHTMFGYAADERLKGNFPIRWPKIMTVKTPSQAAAECIQIRPNLRGIEQAHLHLGLRRLFCSYIPCLFKRIIRLDTHVLPYRHRAHAGRSVHHSAAAEQPVVELLADEPYGRAAS